MVWNQTTDVGTDESLSLFVTQHFEVTRRVLQVNQVQLGSIRQLLASRRFELCRFVWLLLQADTAFGGS